MGNDRPGRVTADTSPSRAGVAPAPFPVSLQPRFTLLYHFCRLQMPAIALDSGTGQRHLQRTYDLFRTKPEGSRLLVCGPANYFKTNAHPLTALIETDWMTMSFTMNYKISIPHYPVRFEQGEPQPLFARQAERLHFNGRRSRGRPRRRGRPAIAERAARCRSRQSHSPSSSGASARRFSRS